MRWVFLIVVVAAMPFCIGADLGLGPMATVMILAILVAALIVLEEFKSMVDGIDRQYG